MRAIKSLKILHFDGLPFPKAYKVLDEKVQKSYLSWHWRGKQSLKKKLTLGSKDDVRNLVNFKSSSGKSQNFHFDVVLLSGHKSTEELYVITLKNGTKFEEELTCALKNDMRNLANFNPRLKSLKICTLMGSFWAKYILFELKNYRGVMCHETEGWYNVWRKIYWCFEKWHKEFD